MGRAESTHIDDSIVAATNDSDFQPGQKREPYWWLNKEVQIDALKREVDQELEERDLKNEFVATKSSLLDSTFDPNITRNGELVLSDIKNSSFPCALNPGFDLLAFLMV